MVEKKGHHKHASKWTEQHEKVLIAKWNEGVPAALTASHLTSIGYPSTKNTVIGRANRLRQSGANVKKHDGKRRPAPQQALVVKQDGCRFIEGTPAGGATVWCGETQSAGSSYCPAHRALTTRPPGKIEA